MKIPSLYIYDVYLFILAKDHSINSQFNTDGRISATKCLHFLYFCIKVCNGDQCFHWNELVTEAINPFICEP